jgi:hypothetical protein
MKTKKTNPRKKQNTDLTKLQREVLYFRAALNRVCVRAEKFEQMLKGGRAS